MIYSHTLGIGATLCEPLTRVRTLAISTLLQHKHVITLLQKYFPPRVKNILVAGMHNFPNRRGRRRTQTRRVYGYSVDEAENAMCH